MTREPGSQPEFDRADRLVVDAPCPASPLPSESFDFASHTKRGDGKAPHDFLD